VACTWGWKEGIFFLVQRHILLARGDAKGEQVGRAFPYSVAPLIILLTPLHSYTPSLLTNDKGQKYEHIIQRFTKKDR
jgi:hypothetical protein